MKVPLWESSPGALVALLNGGVFVQCDLHTFNLSGGADPIYIAAADLDVTYPGGPLWDSKSVRIDPKANRQTAHWKRGLDVDTWLTVVMPRIVDPVTGDLFPDQINGTPWTAAARQGALDGADYQIDRAYFAAWPQPYVSPFTPVGIITLFAGLTAEVDVNDTTVAITSNDYRTLLGTQMPRNVYQGGCGHTLFDAGCTLAAVAFEVDSSVLESATRATIRATIALPIRSGLTYALGRVVMTSGLNRGFSRTITAWDGYGTFYLLNPMPYDISPGDTFAVYPGCDKTQSRCTIFGNIGNFGGQSYIPSPEAAI